MSRTSAVVTTAFVAVAFSATAAQAGPCSDQIASLGKTLSQSSAMGPATTGTLTSSGPSANRPKAGTAPQAAADTKGTSASGKMTGDAGSKEMNAASNQVATSSEDVRRQQQGLPTMANAPTVKTPDDRVGRAKMLLQQATVLDSKGDNSCHGVVDEAGRVASAG